MPVLRYLDLSGNEISDVAPLHSNTALKDYLNLSQNQLIDISPLATLTQLKFLHLSSNLITDISALSSLLGLQYASLNDNAFSSLTPLVNNPNLGSGDYVVAQQNPNLNCTAQADNIATLRTRGLDLTVDCP